MKLLQNQKGSLHVLVAIMLPLLLACTGIAVDIGRLYAEKARLQNLADAAALSALAEMKLVQPDSDNFTYVEGSGKLATSIPVGALSDNSSPELREKANAAADEYLLKNSGEDVFRVGGSGVETVMYRLKNSDSTSTTYTYYYEVIVGKNYPLYFARIVYPKDMLVRAGAVCKIDMTESIEGMDYAYALANWATKDKFQLLNTIGSAQRLNADIEALSNLANVFFGKTKEEMAVLLGNTNSFSDYILANYKETVTDGNVSNSLDVKTGTFSQVDKNDIISWLQGSETPKTYEPNQRYLFSDYAVQKTSGDGNSIKLSITYTGNTVSKVVVAINPGDAASGGSGPLTYTRQ